MKNKIYTILLVVILIFSGLNSCKTISSAIETKNVEVVKQSPKIPKDYRGYFIGTNIDIYYYIQESLITLGSSSDPKTTWNITEYIMPEQNLIQYQSISGVVSLLFYSKDNNLYIIVYLDGNYKDILVRNNNEV